MDVLPFYVPLGDKVLREAPGTLDFTDAMCARFAGGPSQTVHGLVWLTARYLAFRPVAGMPHPQVATLQRTQVEHVEVARKGWRRLLALGQPVLNVTAIHAGVAHTFTFGLDAPEAWAADLAKTPRAARPPRELLDQAIKDGLRDRGRYTSTLAELSFPQGFWHVEAHEDLVEVVKDVFADLEVDLPTDFLDTVDLDVEVLMGPEDYETGPGSESYARREQIRRICNAANEALPSSGRRFCEFAEDLPEWEFDEPVWLLLSSEERRQLVDLEIVHPPPGHDTPD
jgi:hypothetical protein